MRKDPAFLGPASEGTGINHFFTKMAHVALVSSLNSDSTNLPGSSKNKQIDIVIDLTVLDSSMGIGAICYHVQLPLEKHRR